MVESLKNPVDNIDIDIFYSALKYEKEKLHEIQMFLLFIIEKILYI